MLKNKKLAVISDTSQPCGSVAHWSECLHGMREVLGSSPGRAMCFFLPCDIRGLAWGGGKSTWPDRDSNPGSLTVDL